MAPAIDYRALPVLRGYRPLYRTGVACPCCDHRGWLLGRRDAECARCSAALPIGPEVAHA